MKRTLLTIIISLALVLGMVGCEISYNTPKESTGEQRTYILNDGRIVIPNKIEVGDITTLLIALQEDQDYHIIVDCIGGGAFDAVAIMNRMAELQNKGFIITTEVYGYTMSSGAFIFIMGDIRIIHNDAIIMFHGAGFDNFTGRRSLRLLELEGKTTLEPHEQVSLQLIDDKFKKEMSKRTLMTKEDVKKWMYTLDYNFMSAEEAIQLGVATELR